MACVDLRMDTCCHLTDEPHPRYLVEDHILCVGGDAVTYEAAFTLDPEIGDFETHLEKLVGPFLDLEYR